MIQIEAGRESYLLLCPVCFDCWARIQGLEPTFTHRWVPCELHPVPAYGYRFAGCLLEVEECDLDLLECLPPALAEREFHLHMRTFNECPSSPTTPTCS